MLNGYTFTLYCIINVVYLNFIKNYLSNKLAMLYSKNLRKIRKEKKIKIKDIAAFLGKSRFTITSWENGKYHPGSESDIRLMAQLLNVPVGDISDLKELKIQNNNTEKQVIPGFNIEDFSSETVTKLKNLYEASVEQRAANTRLRNETIKYETMLQNLPFIIYVKDKKLKYKYANDKFLDIAGQNYTRNNILGISSFDVFEFKDNVNIQQIKILEERVLLTKEKLSNQQIQIPGTSNQKIGLLTITPILDIKGEVEEIVCSIEDITEEKEAHDKNEIFVLAYEKASEGFWIYDEQKKEHIVFNHAETEITGLTKDDYIIDPHSFNRIISEKDKKRVFQKYLTNKELRKKFIEVYKIKNFRTKEKKLVRVSTYWTTIKGKNYRFGITNDITESI